MKKKSIEQVAKAVIASLNHTAMDDVISGCDSNPTVGEKHASFIMTAHTGKPGKWRQWKVTIEEIE